MAYKRGTRRVRRRSKRNGKSLSVKVHKLAKVVNRTKTIQRVFQDQFVSYASNSGNLAISTQGAELMFNPAVGTGFSERTSPRCELASLDIGGYIITSSVTDVVRAQAFVLRDDWEPTRTVNNYYQPLATQPGAPTAPLTPSSLCTQRYKMLWDSGPRTIGVTGGLHAQIAFNQRVNLKGMKVNFSSQNVPEQNIIYFVVWSQQSPGVSPTYITTTSYNFQAQFHYNC